MGILRRMKQRTTEMEKSYFPYTWRDKPSIESPINSVNLNHIESGINELDNRIVVLSQDKAEKAQLANVFIDFEFDENSGVMTFTRFDGSKVEKDTAMEKIALNCYLEGDNFVLELADGSKQTVSLAKFIDTYTFKSTDIIRMSVNGKEVSADIPDGAIPLEKLEATVMSAIRQYVLDAQTAKGVAEQAAGTAQGWAIGGESFEKNNAKYFSGQSKRYAVGGVEEGDETDNAQYYCEEARKAAEQAAGSVGFDGTAASVSAVDTHNLTGAGAGKKSTVQALLDVIAQKLVEKVVTSDTFQTVLAKYLVNNGLTTEAGKFGLDAAFGKNLQDQITQQNSNIGQILSAYPSSAFITEVGRTYEICSLDLTEGKWLLIGATLAAGNISINNADFGCTTRNWREKSTPELTGLVIAFSTGNKKVKLMLAADFISTQVHRDPNYCYLRAIRIG